MKSLSSPLNSTPVGPPPTTTQCNSLRFSSSESPVCPYSIGLSAMMKWITLGLSRQVNFCFSIANYFSSKIVLPSTYLISTYKTSNEKGSHTRYIRQHQIKKEPSANLLSMVNFPKKDSMLGDTLYPKSWCLSSTCKNQLVISNLKFPWFQGIFLTVCNCLAINLNAKGDNK